MYSIEELEAIMDDGQCDVECDQCGTVATIEPDGDHPCQCGEGRHVSPLVLMGLI